MQTEDNDLHGYLTAPARRMMLLAVNDLGRHTLPALRELLQSGALSVARQAIHIDTNDHASQHPQQQWCDQHLAEMGVPLVVIPSEFGGGDVVGDLVDYIRGILTADPDIT
ncbi:MAG: hypothetical protein ACR2PL_00635, partial [Dehalococcoidia bacterium]